ncbi:hypothetical protein LTR56_022362 [Elasticomyces elasticus]|nr:hypothetical protein LTR56_022362 [Elasticomyces elasticus]KAK3627596.1 hypothetical protein LTR22_022692 [Elasticomyces elasticus]KAK4907737.1 hypothetical protein LTR49_023268 [Elasticomyces elasticus]KAK5742163.1 hypothetical protein LTS12_024342 [Elasticomyces elasticus]
MKTATIVAAAAGILATTQAQLYSLTAIRSGSPIHYLPVNAGNYSLFLGGKSAHYCPESVQEVGGCPNTERTNFAGGEGGLSMGAVVPGGQNVYIEPTCGFIKYTQAHSGFILPGSITDGFNFTQGRSFGTLTAGDGFLACPDNADGTWSVHAVLPNVTMPDTCLGFEAIATKDTKAAAWQYT